MAELQFCNGTWRLLVNGRPFIAIAGEVHNSDSSSPVYMEKIWDCAEQLGMNTLLLPVTWEMTEPEEGTFDFSVPDALLAQARARDKKIVFLWFGSWKNAEMMYAPEWVKTDTTRFRRAEIVKGKNKAPRKNMHDLPYASLSYLCEENCRADAAAFSAFMSHLEQVDREETVIALQVENETGLLGAAREQSDEADRLFASPVPEDFYRYMKSNTGTMKPSVRECVERGTYGDWETAFGAKAEELFSAYYISRYVGRVAAAGKQQHSVPLTVNCWLDKQGEEPGFYPSGGPVSGTQEVWRYCAPEIDLYCPDIYVPDFLEVCREYTRRGGPLFIPETATHSYAAARLAYCIGHHHALCYAPFGFDDMGKPFTFVQGFLYGMDVTDPALKTPQNAEEYGFVGKTLREMLPLLAEAYGTDRLQAVCAEEQNTENLMPFGPLTLAAVFENPFLPMQDNGVLLALKTAENEFFLLAKSCAVQLVSSDPSRPNVDILRLEEGTFRDGIWVPGRRLNGDEATFLMFEKPTLLRLKVHLYC